MEKIIEVIENMMLGEIFDELDLLDGKEDSQSNLLRELLLAELHNRKSHERI